MLVSGRFAVFGVYIQFQYQVQHFGRCMDYMERNYIDNWNITQSMDNYRHLLTYVIPFYEDLFNLCMDMMRKYKHTIFFH